MVAQVLTLANKSDLEDLVIRKLRGYTRPVKTKNLAIRLMIERSDLVATLNKLRSRGVIQYTSVSNDKNDHRGREDKLYGWILSS